MRTFARCDCGSDGTLSSSKILLGGRRSIDPYVKRKNTRSSSDTAQYKAAIQTHARSQRATVTKSTFLHILLHEGHGILARDGLAGAEGSEAGEARAGAGEVCEPRHQER